MVKRVSTVEAMPGVRRWQIGQAAVRLGKILLLAVAIGWVVQRMTPLAYRPGPRAGFGLGIIHGALMPLAMPNLLAGLDLTIYAPDNTGRRYNLGYTIGVNGCGMLFFGGFFWRLKSRRRREDF